MVARFDLRQIRSLRGAAIAEPLWDSQTSEIVLWAVRWYCRYPISYRDLEASAASRSTTPRSIVGCSVAPEMEKRLRWQWRRPQSRSWRVDETYIKVRGKWAYLYRAVDKLGNTIDFYLSATRRTRGTGR